MNGQRAAAVIIGESPCDDSDEAIRSYFGHWAVWFPGLEDRGIPALAGQVRG